MRFAVNALCVACHIWHATLRYEDAPANDRASLNNSPKLPQLHAYELTWFEIITKQKRRTWSESERGWSVRGNERCRFAVTLSTFQTTKEESVWKRESQPFWKADICTQGWQTMAVSHLVVLFCTTAGQNAENLGSDEEQIVSLVYLLYDIANNKVGGRDLPYLSRSLLTWKLETWWQTDYNGTLHSTGGPHYDVWFVCSPDTENWMLSILHQNFVSTLNLGFLSLHEWRVVVQDNYLFCPM